MTLSENDSVTEAYNCALEHTIITDHRMNDLTDVVLLCCSAHIEVPEYVREDILSTLTT